MYARKRQKNTSKDLIEIKKHWENPDTVSLKDSYLQNIERTSIIKFLRQHPVDLLVDIGCGDCSDTIHYTKYAKKIMALDYSDAMLKKATITIRDKNNITLSKFDLMREQLPVKADIIITKRCLINLGNFENQKKALIRICDSLKENGCFLMLEASSDGRNNVNVMRQMVGLPPIQEPFHNVFFDLNNLISFVQKYFYIDLFEHFSTYYFLTRVYNQLADESHYKQFDAAAYKINNLMNLFGTTIIGPQFLMIVRKKKR